MNARLRPRLLAELRPGTRIVSHDFDLGDWQPDRTERVEAPDKYMGTGGTSTIHLWIVPARAAGVWTWRLRRAGSEQPYTLRLTQRFQRIDGTLSAFGRSVPIVAPQLAGDRIVFEATLPIGGSQVLHRFEGRVDRDAVVGRVTLSGPLVRADLEWSAQRRDDAARRPASIDAAQAAAVAR